MEYVSLADQRVHSSNEYGFNTQQYVDIIVIILNELYSIQNHVSAGSSQIWG